MIRIQLVLRPVRRRPTGQRARSRRAVASMVWAWFIAMAAFNFFLHEARPDWNNPRLAAQHQQLRREIRNAGDARTVVILGSSRSQMGLSPAAMTGPNGATGAVVVNFSTPGAGPYRHLLALHRLIESGLRPDAVLIEILPIHLGVESKDSPEVELAHGPAEFSRSDFFAYGPYWRQPLDSTGTWAEARFRIASAQRIAILARTAPWLLNAEETSRFRIDPPEYGGWIRFDKPDMSDAERARRFAHSEREYRNALSRFAVNPDIARVYRDLIDRCRAEGIAVALFFMPESPRFRQWTSPETKHTIMAFVHTLARESGTAVFDATDWIDRETDFSDGHHLLAHGAIPFSERFGRECLAPWLATLPPVVR
jgi:hypothetical protein